LPVAPPAKPRVPPAISVQARPAVPTVPMPRAIHRGTAREPVKIPPPTPPEKLPI